MASTGTPHVRYQSEAALTEELQSLSEEDARRLSPSDIIALFLHRQRVAFMAGKEQHRSVLSRGAAHDARAPAPSPSPTHVLVLGDDGDRHRGTGAVTEEGKRCVVALLAPQQLRQPQQPCDGNGHADAFDEEWDDGAFELGGEEADGSSSASTSLALAGLRADGEEELVAMAPSLDKTDRALCRELLLWCDVVVGCFREGSAESLRSLAEVWLPLRQQALAQLQRESRAILERQHVKGELGVNGWLASEGTVGGPPLLLVGLRDVGEADTPLPVSRAQVQALGQREGALRVVELSARHPGQAAILRRHCVMAREAVYEDFPLRARASFLAAKAAALHLLLKAPPPRVAQQVLSADGAHVAVDLRCAPQQRDQARHPATRNWGGGLRMWQESREGPVPLADGTLTLPLGSAAVSVFSTGRCLFRSDSVAVTPPALSLVPAGYFDPARRCFQCRRHLDDNSHSGPQPIGLRFTFHPHQPHSDYRGAEEVGGEVLQDGAASIPVLPWEEPEEVPPAGAVARPWPSRAQSPPRSLTLTSVVTGGGGGLTRRFAVPTVLPTPTIAFDAAGDGSIRLAPFPPPAHVELRFTLDGSEPTAFSPVYTGPIAAAGRGIRLVRAAAFPKPFFASRETVMDLSRETSTPSMTAVLLANAARDDADGPAASSPPAHAPAAPKSPRPATAAGHPRAGAMLANKAQRLRHAFHTGRYAPPSFAFLSGQRHALSNENSPMACGESSLASSAPRPSRRANADSAAFREATQLSHAVREWSSRSKGRDAPAATRVVTLSPFTQPQHLLLVVIVMRPAEAAGAALVAYHLEGLRAADEPPVTLAWGQLADRPGPQTILMPEEVRRGPVRGVRATFTCRSRRALERIVDVTPHGEPAIGRA